MHEEESTRGLNTKRANIQSKSSTFIDNNICIDFIAQNKQIQNKPFSTTNITNLTNNKNQRITLKSIKRKSILNTKRRKSRLFENVQEKEIELNDKIKMIKEASQNMIQNQKDELSFYFLLFNLFYYFTKCKEITYLIFGLIGSLLSGISLPFIVYLIGLALNTFLIDSGKDVLTMYGKINTLDEKALIIGSKFFVCGGILLFGTFLSNLNWSIIGKRLSQRIGQFYFNSIINEEMSWFDQNNTYELSTKILTKMCIIERGVGMSLGDSIMTIIMFLTSLTVSFMISWQLSFVISSILPLLIIIMLGLTKISFMNNHLKQIYYEKAFGRAEEVLYHYKTVSSFGNNQYEIDRFNNDIRKCRNIGYSNAIKIGIGLGIVMLVVFASYSLTVLYGAYLIHNHTMNYNTGLKFMPGDIITVLFSIIFSAISLHQLIPKFKMVIDSAKEYNEIYRLLQKIKAKKKDKDFVFKVNQTDDLVLSLSKIHLNDNPTLLATGNISFDKVTFAYPLNPNKIIVDSLSFTIESGQKVSFVGESGSGKSTIINLIERFYESNSGVITIDNKPITFYNIKELRNQIGFVPQEPTLFDTTIKDNIIFGRKGVTEEMINSAIQMSYCEEFIKRLDEGINYKVGPNGNRLSGGEKQRIAIARAILFNPKIILLDEATSALDGYSEKFVQDSLEKIQQSGITVVIVAHRLSTVINSDKIIVISKGKKAEEGKHLHLLEKGGIYTDLIRNQALGLDDLSFSSNEDEDESFSQSSEGKINSVITEVSKDESVLASKQNTVNIVDNNEKDKGNYSISSPENLNKRRNSLQIERNIQNQEVDIDVKKLNSNEIEKDTYKVQKKINSKQQSNSVFAFGIDEIKEIRKRSISMSGIYKIKQREFSSEIIKNKTILPKNYDVHRKTKKIIKSIFSSSNVLQVLNNLEKKETRLSKKDTLKTSPNKRKTKNSLESEASLYKNTVNIESNQLKKITINLFKELITNKKMIFLCMLTSALIGLVWPIYGYLFSETIFALSINDTEIIWDDGRYYGKIFLVLALVTSLSIGIQQ